MTEYISRPDNAMVGFKCKRCGNMFSIEGETGKCPVCDYQCSPANCRTVDASDEGY